MLPDFNLTNQTFGTMIRGYYMPLHCFIKFFAEIVYQTENFCNFIDIHNKVF